GRCGLQRCARRIEETQKEKMASVSSGMQLPPGFKMPF
ncbi:hypothetical protein LTSESEN_0801, partial [Salmonella enterica subsp. enterica serovar Senftenberg str. A4-543]